MAKKRWIVITLESLQYYREKDDTKVAGSVSLIGCTINELSIENGEHRFEISNPPDNHVISSNTAKDIEDAIKAIRKGMDQRENAVFGQRLSQVIRRQSTTLSKGSIPNVVRESVKFIRSTGLDEEGLFRLPGNTNKVKDLKAHFDEGIDYIIPEETDIHTVASLLKLYLRELPESLIPSENYDLCVIAINTYDANKFKGINQIIQILNEIPSVNYDLVKFLMKFLNDVQEYSSMNKMDIDNLSTVFGPNMLTVNFHDPEVLMKSTKMLADITKVLIRHYNDIFVISASKPDGSDQSRESTISEDIYQDLEVASSQLCKSKVIAHNNNN
ncbi:uncharacterized protein TRIADDRAFT_59823 [Trichoplax adhaerens]|uniref:Rho-GAP domain-containing protein n=1 Tax=Trichoplax adhaerens TaxID=10228 RepID=B3S6J1_TRIAD|nr:hypothetical protein TRIADDRAFT_59823 [Trichoplax adhaerens]EDV21770.1 hypothetical protein TRIADDRAFT_59823 [Trichoplax adhaerens]|eukprot:XP_002115918.1 hypothetical protein TRIADDRAFT_59823 [Trichoplax adhaerens]